MALTTGDVRVVRRVTAWHFVRLKLRVTGNGLRGQAWRVALFVTGLLFGVFCALGGYLLFAVPGVLGEAQVAGAVASLGGALLVLGWLFLPLVFFGVDETLDPARFALLPLDRRTLLGGLLAASLVGVPAAATLIGTTGIVHSAAALGGPFAGAAALTGVLLGLLLCVAVSRAVTSAFASALRSRRARDLAAVLLAVVAALLGPLQILLARGARSADWGVFARVADVVGWTPLGAPWTLGHDVVAGRPWAVPLKILLTVACVAGLLRWWAASLESAVLAAGAGTGGRESKAPAGGPVAQLFPRLLPWLPHNRFGALVAREVHYWWRETRRRAGLITFTVIGIFLPVTMSLSNGPAPGVQGDAAPAVAGGALVFVGVLAALSLANQFGFEGSAYAANVVAGVPGRTELHSRVLGYTVYLAPLLVLIAVVVGMVVGRPAEIPALLGNLAASYGTGLAVVLPLSVLGAFALPDTSNPFAISSGAGLTKGLLSLGALIGAALASLPVVIAAYLLGDTWMWAGLPVGVAYGAGAYLLGAHLAGRLLDRRMPELLAAVTPNR